MALQPAVQALTRGPRWGLRLCISNRPGDANTTDPTPRCLNRGKEGHSPAPQVNPQCGVSSRTPTNQWYAKGRGPETPSKTTVRPHWSHAEQTGWKKKTKTLFEQLENHEHQLEINY